MGREEGEADVEEKKRKTETSQQNNKAVRYETENSCS